MNNQIQIYTNQDGKVSLTVSFEKETVWLSQSEMAKLFSTSTDNISLHLKNIYLEHELDEISTTEDFSVVRQEGKRNVKRTIKYYNLDAIISVGYRISSKRATQFRQWATQTLKQYLVQGYALNERRLQERGIEFEQVIGLLGQTLSNQSLLSDEGKAVLSVVQDYARSWSLLQAYDEQSLTTNQQKQNNMVPLVLDDVLQAISQLKRALVEKGEATALFGQQRNSGLASAIATIEQGFGDTLFYPNIASRAANLLYFIIKNHPLTDGNKRTGSFLFLWYLRLNQHLLAKPVEQLINDNTLVALALLAAESLPEQKELMIKLIEHFILLKS
ncbi:death-on-curing protein [Aggregatibacter actinomycetemcomitans serotype e str. SC1083]|uniref:Death-on-curing protein n=2 Tax=Aggregatibacter actinomycetemcomitans TaxID=714 RepID=G4A7Z4_AGGAC|nr:virulence protein RhuM/Fic/DOC family protein [Aggregatibacter actinomycetemcomitans]EGY34548.1 death-on-curing protein [Aggregatibacter actinomycetemcomitans serotype e str. SC1083]KYK77862.1 death-on-curing protein [Aggregatibacter actinomycetemcomitans serotype e str. SC936]